MIGISREEAQRRYGQVIADIGEVLAALAVTGQAMDRYVLLTRHAAAEEELAALHPAAFGPDPIEAEGGRDMAESLAGAAQLLHLVASTELAIALAGWTTAQDLKAGGQIWYRGWQTISALVPGSFPGIWRVEYADGTERVNYAHDELVRTDGADGVEVTDLVRAAGGDSSEAAEWGHLAVTASRDHRAAMMRLMLAPMAAERVGERAAGVLCDLADEEDRLAVTETDDAGSPGVLEGGLAVAEPAPAGTAELPGPAEVSSSPAPERDHVHQIVLVSVVALVSVVLGVVLGALGPVRAQVAVLAIAAAVMAVRPTRFSRGGGA